MQFQYPKIGVTFVDKVAKWLFLYHEQTSKLGSAAPLVGVFDF